MSTKTTFKRVALVAVAALGLGVLSVAPSQAASNADTLTLSSTTAAVALGDTATATSPTVTLSYLAGDWADSMTVTASLTSGPSTSSVLPKLQLVETTAGQVYTTVVLGTTALTKANTTQLPTGATNADGGAAISSNAAAYVVPLRAQATSTRVSAKFKVYLDAPAVAGTYVVKLTPAVSGGGGSLQSAAQSITFTVAATVTKPDSTSTAYIAQGAAIPNGADSATVTGVKTAATQAATIDVTQKIADVATNAKESMTAVITGSGTLGSGSALTAAATGRAIIVKYDDYITVWADGTSGAGNITVTGVDSGIVYKTATVTFYDSVPKTVTVTVKKAYPAAGKTTTSAVYATVKDASGNVVTNATVSLRPATTGTGETTTSCAYSATYSTNVCSVTGTSVSKFGKVSYIAKVVGADTDETELSSAAFDLTFADIVATKVAITAPATANVGDKVTVTLTATEKNGYPVADSTYEGVAAVGGIFWNTTTAPAYSSSSFAPFNTGETITTLSGVATKDVYLPAVSGTVTGTWTLAGTADANVTTGAIDKTISGGTVAVSIAVSNPGVDAATDAANEATDAANAATDAALAAADAADAATAAAQDASDAVAALSATVAKLVASLKAQITSLTNLVIKIQKKVRA
ncbi:hypothetical protein MCEMRE195_00059 [Candidatus Nanopelagicaceae bacterium]